MILQSAPISSPHFNSSFNLPAEPAFIPFAPVEHRIPFARVPRTLLIADGITLRDIKVYAAILSFPANVRHERWPGREKIGELTGLPPKVVSRTTTHLQKLGWLAKQGDGGRSRTTRYVIFDRAQPPEVIATWEWLPLPSRKRKPSSKQPRKQRVNSAQTAPVSTPQTAPFDVETVPVSTPESALNSPQIEEGQVTEDSDSAQKRECSEPAPSKPARSLPPSDRSRKERTTAPATVPDDWIDMAIEMRPDLTAEQISRSAGRFLDFHRGKGSEFKDWLPIWRIWISKERVDSRSGPSQARTATSAVNRYSHLDRAKEPPTEAELRQEAEAEARRITMLIANGIDPATGLKIIPPVSPIVPEPSAAPAPAQQEPAPVHGTLFATPPARPRLTSDELAAMIAMSEAGMTLAEIRKAIGK